MHSKDRSKYLSPVKCEDSTNAGRSTLNTFSCNNFSLQFRQYQNISIGINLMSQKLNQRIVRNDDHVRKLSKAVQPHESGLKLVTTDLLTVKRTRG